MITIIGNQPSAITLREATKHLISNENITVCWGARNIGVREGLVLNGLFNATANIQLECFTNTGVRSVEYTDIPATAIDWERNNIKTFGRRWTHERGNDIVGSGYKAGYNGWHEFTTRKGNRVRRAMFRPEYFNPSWLNRDFWVKIIPSNLIIAEWRVHIFQGRSIAKGLKVQTGPTIRRQPVRNRANGWTLDHTAELPINVREAARRAVAAVGYNFGAVDLFEMNDGDPIVLEVNSAPALLSEYTLNAYTNAISKLATGGYRKIYMGRPIGGQ